jgi:salicylate hydroxylase
VTLRIGIIGAGIGGLTAALACREAGFEVHVFEAAPAIEPLGAGLQLSPNATKVLRALGVLDAVAAVAVAPEAVQFRDWRTGYLIAFRPLGAVSEARYGAPYLHVHRGDLQSILLATAEARGVALYLGARCVGCEELPERIVARFERHPLFTADVLVGCDGIRSIVRAALLGADSPRFTGHVAWRGLVPKEQLPQGLVPRTATVWLGPRRHFVHYWVAGGAFVNLVGVVESPWNEESWTIAGDPAELAREFAGWHTDIGTLIGAADHVFKWALYDRDPLPVWSRGRVTLLGDAAHPMLPFMAQGAASAIEDGWILSRLLQEEEEDPAGALVEYERYRKPRTARLQLASRAQGERFHESRRLHRWRRNLVLGFGCRVLPDLAMQQLDWVHGYEAVRGF